MKWKDLINIIRSAAPDRTKLSRLRKIKQKVLKKYKPEDDEGKFYKDNFIGYIEGAIDALTYKMEGE